jgi:hypothetical protein
LTVDHQWKFINAGTLKEEPLHEHETVAKRAS